MSDAETTPAESVSFLQRFRVHLIAGAVAVLVLLALMGGMAAGMAKRNFEKQFYLDQIEKLKRALEKSVEQHAELEQELSETKIQLRARKEHVEELEFKLESMQKRAQQQGAEAAAPVVQAEAGHAASAGGKTETAPLPRLAGDCTVKSGATGVSSLQNCLRPGTGQKQAVPGEDKTSENHGEKPAKAH